MGAGARIRQSNAESAAFDPSPMAMTICLNGVVVASPAANTPGADVSARVDLDLAAGRKLQRAALQPIGVRHEPDLDKDPVEVEPMKRPRSRSL